MDSHQIRYLFEHRILPQWFFEGKSRFAGMLLNDKTVLFRIIDDIFQKEETDNPYIVEQFGIETSKVTDDVVMIKIILPEPEEEPLCYCCYLFFDQDFEKPGFFCIERGNNIGSKTGGTIPFVCSWTADGSHHNHGNCSLENNQDLIRCTQLYQAGIINSKPG